MESKKKNLEQDFLPKSPLERQIEITVAKWKPIHKKFQQDFRWFTDATQLKEEIKTIRRADRLLKRLAPWLRSDDRVDRILVKSFRDNVSWQGKVIDYYAEVGLNWVADWLAEITQKGGRVPEAMIANCAEELAATFKEHTGKSKWAKVGEIMAEHFGKNPTEPRLWIYGIVKRNRRRREAIAKNRNLQLSGLAKEQIPTN